MYACKHACMYACPVFDDVIWPHLSRPSLFSPPSFCVLQLQQLNRDPVVSETMSIPQPIVSFCVLQLQQLNRDPVVSETMSIPQPIVSFCVLQLQQLNRDTVVSETMSIPQPIVSFSFQSPAFSTLGQCGHYLD